MFRALIDARAVAIWMVPPGMPSHVHEFDAREGGAFRSRSSAMRGGMTITISLIDANGGTGVLAVRGSGETQPEPLN